MDLKLTAFCGEKPHELGNLVTELQQRLTSLLGSGLSPCEPKQLHSTIIALEGRRDGDRVLNSNFLKLRLERRYMDVGQLIETINRVLELLPIRILLCGHSLSTRVSP